MTSVIKYHLLLVTAILKIFYIIYIFSNILQKGALKTIVRSLYVRAKRNKESNGSAGSL